MSSRPKARRLQAFALAASIALMASPIGNIVRAESVPPARPPAVIEASAPDARTANRWAGAPSIRRPAEGTEPAEVLFNAPAEQPKAAVAAQPAPDVAPKAAIMADDSKVSEKVREQAGEKRALQDRLAAVPNIGAARAGETVDPNQPSVAESGADKGPKVSEGDLAAFAYIRPYMEPADYAHRNYCGPGSAIAALSHWDGDYPNKADIDEVGEAMEIDPSMGVWIKDIVKPVNDEVSKAAGQDINWYRYGQAQSLDDLRYMIHVDIGENGVPFITGLMTGGLPGWGQTDVGHIVAVYGYHKDSSGTEWVHYADTAPPTSGYKGTTFNVVKLETFWHAVSQNSAQVW